MEFPVSPGARALPVLYSLSQLFDLYKWDQISFWNEIYTYIIRSPWSNIGFQVLGFTMATILEICSFSNSLLKAFFVLARQWVSSPQDWRLPPALAMLEGYLLN